MQILYVVGMMAVFVLCLALLSTARRILRSSPLESGQLALSSIQDFERSDDEGFIEVHTVDAISPIEETEVQWGEDFEDFETKAVEAETPANAQELLVQETPVAAEKIALVPNSPIVTVAEEAVETGPAETPCAVSFRKSSRRTYNYALECVLLGVSAWVLIQTQRSNMQHRQPERSSGRVA